MLQRTYGYDAWHTWAQQLPINGAGLRIASVPPVCDAEDAARRDAVLASLGYAAIPGSTQLGGELRRRVLHRHVALIIDERFDDTARQWIRDLAFASPRAHLILRSPSDVVAVRERARDWPSWTDGVSAPTPRGVRRRRTAARDWYSAAIETAARRGDECGSAMALQQYGDLVLRSGASADVARLRARGRAWLERHVRMEPRSRVAATVALAALSLGDAEAATAVVAAQLVEFELENAPAAPWVVSARADLALFAGEWHTAARAIQQLDTRPVEAWGRRALLAWLQQDAQQLGRAADVLNAGGPESGPERGWLSLGLLLVAAARSDAAEVHARVPAVADDAPLFWAKSSVVEALRAVGADDPAEKWLAKWRSHTAGSEALLLAQLAREPARRPVTPPYLAGTTRWGERRSVMTMWGGVSALLDEVNNAEDDVVALRRGCRWVRTHTGTPHVVVLAADTGAALMSDPDGARPGEDDVRVPVRQSGVTIAWVMAGRRARDAEELAGCARTLAAVCAPAVRARLDIFRATHSGDGLAQDLCGQSPAMVALRAAVARAAPTTFPVLIEGESGVGKELVARALHRLSPRRDRRLAAINCAALTDELFEAELFGHTRGAFTGAISPRTGLFEDAHQGTLFLDEVGELSPRAQAKLLRVLQEGEIRRIGDNHPRTIDVRVVAATNRKLSQEAAAGRFREDLVFRLAVVRLNVPPLRERAQDIPGLAQTFWVQAARHRESRAWLTPDALAALCRYQWPGNVRELQNVISGLVLAAPVRGRVTARHVAAVLHAQGANGEVAGVSLQDARRLCDRRVVMNALARHGGCRAAAARDLGVTRQGLSKLMTRLAVPAEGV